MKIYNKIDRLLFNKINNSSISVWTIENNYFDVYKKQFDITKFLRSSHTLVCGLFGTLGCSRHYSTLKCGILVKCLDIIKKRQNG